MHKTSSFTFPFHLLSFYFYLRIKDKNSKSGFSHLLSSISLSHLAFSYFCFHIHKILGTLVLYATETTLVRFLFKEGVDFDVVFRLTWECFLVFICSSNNTHHYQNNHCFLPYETENQRVCFSVLKCCFNRFKDCFPVKLTLRSNNSLLFRCFFTQHKLAAHKKGIVQSGLPQLDSCKINWIAS